MNPPSKLGKKIAAGTTQGPAVSTFKSKLRQVIAGRRGELVEHPTLGAIWLELPGAARWAALDAQAHAAVQDLGFTDLKSVQYVLAYEGQLAQRVLADAARDPDDHTKAFGSLEEWGDLDNDLVNYAWHLLGDVRERLDPVASTGTEDDMIAISVAVKKKDAPSLRSFGVVKLSHWLATTGAQLWTSLLPSSPSSDSSSDPTTPSVSASEPEPSETPTSA